MEHFVWPVAQVVVPDTERSASLRFTPSFWSTGDVLLNVTRQETSTSSKALGAKQNLCKCSNRVPYPVSDAERVPTVPKCTSSSKARPIHSIIWPHSTQSGIRIHWTTVYQECEKNNNIFLLTMSITRNMKMKIIENFWVQVNVPHLSFNNNSSKEKTQLLKKSVVIKIKGRRWPTFSEII